MEFKKESYSQLVCGLIFLCPKEPHNYYYFELIFCDRKETFCFLSLKSLCGFNLICLRNIFLKPFPML